MGPMVPEEPGRIARVGQAEGALAPGGSREPTFAGIHSRRRREGTCQGDARVVHTGVLEAMSPLDHSVYPDMDNPPALLETVEAQADYVHRICSAWDYGVHPEPETFTL